VTSNRIIAFMAVILYLILTILIQPILFVWLDVTSSIATQIAWIMNTAMFALIIFKSGSGRILIMTNHYKFVAIQSSIEAVLNIALSIIFIKLFNEVGVALGTLVPSIIMSVFIIFPVACAFSGVSIWHYIRNIYAPLTLLALLPAAILAGFVHYIPLTSWNVTYLALATILSTVSYLVPGYLFFFSDQERAQIKRLLKLQGKPKNRGLNLDGRGEREPVDDVCCESD